jgi:hypothetical protein
MCENTITRINGNKQPYTTDLPKIIILEHWNPVAMAHVKENTGLDFEEVHYGMIAQPTDANQIVTLFLTYNFKTRYFNNWDAKNTLYLKSDHHIGFDVDSICYDCVQHNHITTNGLKPGDYLAC